MRPHPDDDALALHALGEPSLTGEDVEHVRGCERCHRTVAELTRTVDVVRGPRSRDLDAEPVPAHLWDGIAARLGLQDDVRPRTAEVAPATAGAAAAPAVGADPTGADPTGGVTTAPAQAAPVADELDRRRVAARRRDEDRATGSAGDHRGGHVRGSGGGAWRLLAVAAAGVLVGGAGAVLLTSLPGGDRGPADVVAAADLEEFGTGEGTGMAGTARLVAEGTGAAQSAGGRTVLQVWLDGVPDTGQDFLEAWLIDAETGDMVSLGPVPADAGDGVTVDLWVPPGVDVQRFALVDVSSEPPDGDPTHSGASLVRGALDV